MVKHTRKQRNDFKNQDNAERWYDLIDDYGVIEASFLQQYGIRLRTTEMEWSEFSTLLSGIDHNTPLANIVSIRSEDDPERLKLFTADQKRIRREWRSKATKNMTKAEYDDVMEQLKSMFTSMAKK